MILLYIMWVLRDMSGRILGMDREYSFLATLATSGIGVVCGVVLVFRDRSWWRAVGIYTVVLHAMVWPATLIFLARIWRFLVGAE